MMSFSGLSWREVVISVIVMLAIYAGIALFKLSQLRLARPPTLAADWKQDPAEFGEHLYRDGLEAELNELRTQVTYLQEEVGKLKAARTVSPQYGEAVALAQQGLDVAIIAERCDISVAEAELVRALSNRQM